MPAKKIPAYCLPPKHYFDSQQDLLKSINIWEQEAMPFVGWNQYTHKEGWKLGYGLDGTVHKHKVVA